MTHTPLMLVPKVPRRLFFDIETSPNVVYSWRTGFKLNISPENIVEERSIVCIGYKWQGESKVHCLRWRGRGDDRDMLAEFIPIMESATEVVAHYGDRFDIPWVRARAAFHGLPMSPYIKSIDTKAQASRNFYFNSNKLDYLAQYLNLGKKLETDYQLWKDVMNGDLKALDRMIRYCKHDVVILEKLFLYMENYNKPKTNYAVLDGGPKFGCPKCGSEDVGRRAGDQVFVSAAGTKSYLMSCRATGCGSRYKINECQFNRWEEEMIERKRDEAA